MKKILLLILLFMTTLLGACTNDEPNKPSTIENNVTIIAPNGTPYIALGGLLNTENIEITAVNGADNLKSGLVEGSYDIIIAPINVGAQLFKKGNSQYKIAAVITMNNAYIVTTSDNKLDSIDDLANQQVLGFGANGIPGSILKTLYNKNDNLNVENIDFTQSSSSAVYSLFANNSNFKYALLSQPEIAKLQINDNKNIKTLDLCDALGTDVPQACIFVNPNSEHLDDVNTVLNMIKDNIKTLNNNPNDYVDSIISLDRNYAAIGSEVLKASLPNMDIIYNEALNMKTEIDNILTILGVGDTENEFYYS